MGILILIGLLALLGLFGSIFIPALELPLRCLVVVFKPGLWKDEWPFLVAGVATVAVLVHEALDPNSSLGHSAPAAGQSDFDCFISGVADLADMFGHWLWNTGIAQVLAIFIGVAVSVYFLRRRGAARS